MKFTVSEKWHGLTVKKVLLDRLGFSRSAVTALKMRDKGILVNGERKTVRFVLSLGDELSLQTEDTEPSPRIRPINMPIDVLYEDDAFLAVNKPAGLAVHPSKKLQDDTLAGRIMYHRYPMVFRAAGRLDRDTSGVVVCAKSQVVSARFFHMLRRREIRKEYLLITCGEGELEEKGRIELSIRRDEESYIQRVTAPPAASDAESERALTLYRTLARNGKYRLILASPVTGRTHQLRAHFAGMGHPLLSDTLYGVASDRIGRQALHAMRLRFCHPQTGEEMCLSAPLPEDMKRAIQDLFGEDFPTDPNDFIFDEAL